jgi:hypothetical protein
MNYTPGPWMWWTSNSFLRLSSQATGKDGDVIDSFKMSDGATSVSVKVPDMHLIAAAPDLLESLQWAMKQIGGYHNRTKSNGIYCDAVDRANAAIAKALGEE